MSPNARRPTKPTSSGHLEHKYRKILAVPDWDENELEEMGYNLRLQVEAGIALKTSMQRRIPSETNGTEVPTRHKRQKTDETELAIERLSALVGPILNQLFAKAATNEDMWLKKKSVKRLADWIRSGQDIADIMHQTIEQMGEVLTAQEAELEELRPSKGKVWIPGI